MNREEIISNFRTERYDQLNALRWGLFLKMEIPIEGKIIFEPGAGIGDQTKWLLSQGAKHIYVNDGRSENLHIIRERFPDDPRLTFLLGNLEDCLKNPEFQFTVDLIFMLGVYYHLNDSQPDFHILNSLSRIGPIVVFDYLESLADETDFYGYDNPSTSLSRFGIRPTTPTMMKGLRRAWGYAYIPKTQMSWNDEGMPRRLAVGSRTPLDNAQLELQ